MAKNHYEVLGISQDASTTEIKIAYRKKALKCHPDKTFGLDEISKKQAEEEFKKINEAHETLSDPEKKQAYDHSTFGIGSKPKQINKGFCESSFYFSKTHDNGPVKLSAYCYKFVYHDDSGFKFELNIDKVTFKTLFLCLEKIKVRLQNKRENDPRYDKAYNKVVKMQSDFQELESVFMAQYIDYQVLLRALEYCKDVIEDAKKDGVFATHHGFARNCPIIRELCILLDIIINFAFFLAKKIRKILSGDFEPVFKNIQEFKHSMFKPMPTTTAREIDEFYMDTEWYVSTVNELYQFGQSSRF